MREHDLSNFRYPRDNIKNTFRNKHLQSIKKYASTRRFTTSQNFRFGPITKMNANENKNFIAYQRRSAIDINQTNYDD